MAGCTCADVTALTLSTACWSNELIWGNKWWMPLFSGVTASCNSQMSELNVLRLRVGSIKLKMHAWSNDTFMYRMTWFTFRTVSYWLSKIKGVIIEIILERVCRSIIMYFITRWLFHIIKGMHSMYMLADVPIWIIIALSATRIHVVTQQLALLLNTHFHRILACVTLMTGISDMLHLIARRN